jgi:16S rRNA (adenine1518-N6/adenine1519-N6)-dimethyltransferase
MRIVQTLSEIRAILESAQRRPVKAFGQNFLIDGNLMALLLDLAAVGPEVTVLEVGPGTGSLTEELLARARRVLAVEVDDYLCEILPARLAERGNFTLIHRDVLAGKHAIAPEVLSALAGDRPVHMVSNLPYSAAVPVILNALELSWRSLHADPAAVRFERLTFTVQRELAERLIAGPGSDAYGAASVIVALLARPTAGRVLPPEAFWPRPQVHSQMLRLDFDPATAEALKSIDTLQALLQGTFSQRRKTLASSARSRAFPFPPERFAAALAQANISPSARPEELPPATFRELANLLTG